MRWLIAAMALVWLGAAEAQEAGPGRLTVTGEGRVDSVPDMATITVGVTHEARSAARALAETSAATAEVLRRLADAGIAPRDMQTRDLSLQPLWDNRSSSGSGPRVTGYEAGNTVMVRVRALEVLGAVLDEVVESGANRFHGLSFGLQDPGPARDEARRRAVAEAMRKAELYAVAAGLVLGPVLELSEAGAAGPAPEMMARAAMASPVPVAAGEVSVAATVTMVFAISGP
ncbi:MAG: SIMPL domain-containing protein [Rhodobacteraceae bacterium]|nr:SIMPL domain-containing protein [Paracoccaceae bacterium]